LNFYEAFFSGIEEMRDGYLNKVFVDSDGGKEGFVVGPSIEHIVVRVEFHDTVECTVKKTRTLGKTLKRRDFSRDDGISLSEGNAGDGE
jgi:hypothetical protein